MTVIISFAEYTISLEFDFEAIYIYKLIIRLKMICMIMQPNFPIVCCF